VRLDAATARIGPAQISASGRVNPGALLAEGQVALDAPDLAPFAPLIGQPVRGAVRLRATLEPRDGKQGVDARLEIPGLTAAGVVVERLALTAAGTPDAMDLTLAGRVQQVALDARARVTQPEEGAIRLELPSLRAEAHGETLRLAAPARITRRPDGAVEIGSLSLARDGRRDVDGRGRLGAGARRPPCPPRGAAPLRAVGLPARGPPGRHRLGRHTGHGFRGRAAGERGAARPGAAGRRTLGQRAAAVNLNVQATRAGSGAVEARAEAVGGNALRLQAALRMPRGPGQAAPVEARLDGRVDLGAVAGPLLAAGADRVSGRLDLALRAGGTTAAPRLDGEARLTGGSWRNGAIGAAVTDLRGTIRAEGTRLRVDLAGRSTGDGRIALRGAVDPLSPGLPCGSGAHGRRGAAGRLRSW
jgi:translocation and assembly module TamB